MPSTGDRLMTAYVVNSLMMMTLLVIIPALLLGTAYLFRKLDSKERLLAIEKGLYHPSAPQEVYRRTRRAAIVLIAAGIGVALVFVIEAAAKGTRAPLASAGLGVVPLAVGLGMLIDLRLQRRDLR
jgi:hypothetical protein